MDTLFKLLDNPHTIFFEGYVVPLIVLSVVFTREIIAAYKLDKRLINSVNLKPTVTVGFIVGRFVIAFTPVINLVVAVALTCFYIGSFLHWLFSIPLVRRER